MPTYEYECKHCGHRFERFQHITEDPVNVCPKCGRRSVRRLFGGGLGIIFKGSGFYTTDYKRSSALTSGNGSTRSKTAPEGEDGERGASAAKQTKPSASEGGTGSGSGTGPGSGGSEKS